MAAFDQYPPQTRKKIALGVTAAVAVILVVVLVIVTVSTPSKDNESGSKIKNFYTTILQNGQSFFNGN